VLAVWLARDAVSVPLDVTGEPVTVKIAGRDNATLVTVPAAYPCALTYAVVATVVLLSLVAGVVADAEDPSATVPLKVLLPEMVCVLVSVQNAPVPPMARTVPPVIPMYRMLSTSE
jgi:hypothetical protein